MLDRSFCLRNSFTIPPACRERFAALAEPAFTGWQRAGVLAAGESELVPGYGIANPRPERVMVIVTTAGRGAAVTPTGSYALTPGTLLVGPPGVPVGWATDGERWSLVWWYLRPARRWAAWCADAAVFAPCARAGLLGALVGDLYDRCRAAPDDPLAASAADLALRHLDELAASPAAAPASAEDRFAALWREVAAQPQHDWSLPRLAARLRVSVSTAQRVARAHLGQPAHRALVGLRLARARELLRGTAYPVQVVAELVGYADAFTFSAAYRRWAGRPPNRDRLAAGRAPRRTTPRT